MQSLRARWVKLINYWNETKARNPRLATRLKIGSGVFASLLLVSSVWLTVSLLKGLPNPEELSRIGEMDQATSVYDGRDQLAFTIFKEQRIDVPLEQVAPSVVKAILAIEDQQFYDHRGFNLVRIGFAAFANLRYGRAAQGGSTITQQLARLSFLTPDKTLRRKLQELILARRIEASFSKDQILELYLNKVYFGDGLYGIEAASRGYFGKPARFVSVAEAALLAGLVKSPSSYAPTVRLDRAVARRNVVLQAMRRVGAINAGELAAARASKVVLQDSLHNEETTGLYFKEQVRLELVSRFGWERVYQGGLRVFSTIDLPMQRSAESAVSDGLKAIEERRAALARKRKNAAPPETDAAPLQAALIAMEPGTGHVLAMVGGRDFDESHFNRAVQAKRQAGSAFKPFVYAAALEAGYTPATVIDNLNEPIATMQGAWTPEEGHSGEDSMTLRAALRISSNRAAVRLLQQVGIPRTVQYAKTMGVDNLPSVPSLALGSGDVTLQSMTAAYAGFANQGDVPRPLLIRRVEDRDGQVLFSAEDSVTHAVSATTAYLMTTMLADVINAGTGSRARGLGFTLPAAGKTGTTNDYNDAWFIGYTPSLVAGVWVGFDQPRTIISNGFASEVAVPVWANFMKAATKGNKPAWFRAPPGIVTGSVCRVSGLLATEGCEQVATVDDDGYVASKSMVYTEYFQRGTVPTAYCDLHASRGVVGSIASIFTGHDKPAPVHIETPPAPPMVVASEGADVPPPPRAEEPPKKKRGFWSRVFGVGDDKDEDKAKDKDKAENDKARRQ